jgi:hypothetical protein
VATSTDPRSLRTALDVFYREFCQELLVLRIFDLGYFVVGHRNQKSECESFVVFLSKKITEKQSIKTKLDLVLSALAEKGLQMRKLVKHWALADFVKEFFCKAYRLKLMSFFEIDQNYIDSAHQQFSFFIFRVSITPSATLFQVIFNPVE